MTGPVKLVSFELCPYVQRTAIVLAEKNAPFERIFVDLSDKPKWFTAISPLGKVPLLQVGETVLFESAPIMEYLDETLTPRLHPEPPLERARHRAWMEFGSSILADIWVLETTADARAYDEKILGLKGKFAWLERELNAGPWFAGERFSIVDAVFAPIFRYFEVFEKMAPLNVFEGLPRVQAWRAALAERPSVRNAVVPDYAERLRRFVYRRDGRLAAEARARGA